MPVSAWQVIPHFCDGVGLSTAPDPVTVPGDPGRRGFDVTVPAGDALLGRGLSFQVEGIGPEQTVGVPAGDGSCSYSWAAPVPGDITVSASAPAGVSSSTDTTDTTVTVGFRGGVVRDLGGLGGRLHRQADLPVQ